MFVGDYKHFFCGYSEPSYLKHVKVEILEKVATKQNMHEVSVAGVCTLLR